MSNNNKLANRSERPSINEYVDSDEYEVWEYITPTSFMQTKTKGDLTSYIYVFTNGGSKSTYRGTYSKQEADAWKKEFDNRMKQFDFDMDAWNREMDNYLKEHSSFHDFPEFSDFPGIPDFPVSDYSHNYTTTSNRNSSQYQYQYSSPTKRSVYRRHRTSVDFGCLGCLFWSIISLVVTSVIIYGLFKIGGGVCQFIWDILIAFFNFVKSLF